MDERPDVPEALERDGEAVWAEPVPIKPSIRSSAPPRSAPDPDSDLGFIDRVLADLIVFAQLNRLEELGRNLAEAHAKFRDEVASL